MNPTPRPWKEQREELSKIRAALLKQAGHDDVEEGFSGGLLRAAEAAIDECLREIDRRGELIGRLAEDLRRAAPQDEYCWACLPTLPNVAHRKNCYRVQLLREADQVRHG